MNLFDIVMKIETRLTVVGEYLDMILQKEKRNNFTEPLREPEVAKSQQYLADRLSEAEVSEDEHWLGEGLG